MGGWTDSINSHDALLRSRAALANPADTGHYIGWAHWPDFVAADPPDSGCESRLARWDGWVIPYIVLPNLLSGLRVQSLDNRSISTLEVGDQKVLTLHRPSTSLFRAQLADVIADAELRDDRAPEILMQTHNTLAFFATVLPLAPARTTATLRLLHIANQLALFVEMQMKHIFACARPFEYSPQVQPMITTPGHGTYPMGHGCEARVTARLLAALTEPVGGADPAWSSMAQQLDRLAERIADNRIVAGVHFKVDQGAGRALGDALADYLVGCGRDDASGIRHRVFDPATDALQATETPATRAPTLPTERLEEFRLIWQHARWEWRWLNNEPRPQS